MTWEDIIKFGIYSDSTIYGIINILKQAEQEGKICFVPELTDREKEIIGTDVEICQPIKCANCHDGCVRKSIFLKKRSS